MAAHDEQVEKVARAIYEAGPKIRVGSYRWEDLTQLTHAIFYAHARAAIAAMGEGWRDIASAPKDGTWLWLFWPETAYAEDRQCVGHWYRDTDTEYWMDPHDSERGEPTHWRPLPPPPGEKP